MESSRARVPFVTAGSTNYADLKRERELLYTALYVRRRLHLTDLELKNMIIELDTRLERLSKIAPVSAGVVTSKNEEEEGEHARPRSLRYGCCLRWVCLYVPLYFVLAFVTFAIMSFVFKFLGWSGSIPSHDFLQLPQ